jgi:hypothetical protein
MSELVRRGHIFVMHPDLKQTNWCDAGAKQQTRRSLPQATDELLESMSPFTTNDAIRETAGAVVETDASSDERPTEEGRHTRLAFQ